MIAVRHACEAFVFRLLLLSARWLPRTLLRSLGAASGRLAFGLDRRHRRVTLDNLARAYGALIGRRALHRIARDCWRHFGRITLDTLHLAQLEPDRLRALVEQQGLEHVRAAYARGKGVLLFTGHFGHWELAAMVQGYCGLPMLLVARPLDNPRLESMLSRLRERPGNEVVHKRRAVRRILHALNQGGGVAIVIDQDARHEGIFVPFFGRPASTTPTLALLALRSGATIIPSYTVPRSDGSYHIVYEEPIAFTPSGNRDADIRELTMRCTAILEGWVRRQPEMWLWMHRRWKTQPPTEPV
jgi:KDO2-lipid IV(A) lauroyltransferase